MSKSTGASDIAKRYAAALYDLSDERGALDAVAGDLKALKGMIADSAEFARFLKSPVLSRRDQEKGALAVLEKAGAHELTKNFVGLVARNRRLFAVEGMIEAFLAELARRRGEVTAEVTAAKELNEKQRSDLAAALKKAIGKDIDMDVRVDPGLLGGLIVKVGSRMVDGSLRTKLQRLELVMKGIG